MLWDRDAIFTTELKLTYLTFYMLEGEAKRTHREQPGKQNHQDEIKVSSCRYISTTTSLLSLHLYM